MKNIDVERVQTGVRLEKRLVKVMKAVAELRDITLGDLIEGLALHAFDGVQPFSEETLEAVARLKMIYGLDLDASHSHRLADANSVPEDGAPFVASHRRFAHRIALPLAAIDAVELFTPQGELLWAEGWDPTFLHPVDGVTRPGLVFTTGADLEKTYWTVADFDRVGGRARYIRVTPASRSGIVEVAVQPVGAGTCEVEVAYEFTGLTSVGNAAIEAMSEEDFEAMIDGWGEMIAAYIDGRESQPT
ncbi:hypothetical protein [Microbacterium lushaniae]|uniref:hypothetical protein n=1 Tax=Microbacterium lushaniae TaxID=2614639 RepID=UPI001930EF3B|nr:hypothetical protein [Microbacterium lushaniae]